MKTFPKLAALTVAASLSLVACGGGDDGGSDSSSDTTEAPSSGGSGASGDAVTIKNFKYDPDALEVEAGTAVTFTNEDGDVHTATSRGDVPMEFDTGDLEEGDSKEITFEEPGTYTYICDLHQYMKGEVTVQ